SCDATSIAREGRAPIRQSRFRFRECRFFVIDGSVDAEPVEQRLVAAPVLPDANLEVEEDLSAELALELAPGRGADLPDHPPPLADQDRLLGLRFGPDVG